MEPVVTGNLALDILLWVCLAVAAGFFGYFGRRMSEVILNRRRARRSKETSEPPADAVDALPSNPAAAAEKARLKAEKKRLKAAQKRAKKAPD